MGGFEQSRISSSPVLQINSVLLFCVDLDVGKKSPFEGYKLTMKGKRKKKNLCTNDFLDSLSKLNKKGVPKKSSTKKGGEEGVTSTFLSRFISCLPAIFSNSPKGKSCPRKLLLSKYSSTTHTAC